MVSSWYIYILVGLMSGMLSGTFGVGAGIIIIPCLIFLDDIKQHDAQAISLAVMVPMAFMGAWRYHANPDINLDFRLALIIVAGALVGAWIGAHFAGTLSGLTLRRLFAGVLIIVATRMLLTK